MWNSIYSARVSGSEVFKSVSCTPCLVIEECLAHAHILHCKNIWVIEMLPQMHLKLVSGIWLCCYNYNNGTVKCENHVQYASDDYPHLYLVFSFFCIVTTCLHHKLLYPSQYVLLNNSVVHAVYLSCSQAFVVPYLNNNVNISFSILVFQQLWL